MRATHASTTTPGGAPVHYERHRPERTTLDRLVQQYAATFFAQAEAQAGVDLPRFVKDEFDAFLECGILAHGVLRLRCGGQDKLDPRRPNVLAVVAAEEVACTQINNLQPLVANSGYHQPIIRRPSHNRAKTNEQKLDID